MLEMNILYGIDEGKKDYSRYLGVSILSLLENNKDENVHIYVLSKYIEQSNKAELIRIVKSFGKKIYFSSDLGFDNIIPEKFKDILCLKGGWPLAAYYRWFFLECFDIKGRLLYLDCDTIINKNLSEFYNTDFEGNVFVGNMDIPVTLYDRRKKYGLKKYINSGVTLINVDLFKKYDLYGGVIGVNKKYGPVDYVDQDYINLMFNDKIKIYNNLQCIMYYKWEKYKYHDFLIFHTVEKPNRQGLCPKEMESLFNKYLAKTKRKNYVGYKQDFHGINLFIHIYEVVSRFFEWLFLSIFGGAGGYYVKHFFKCFMHFLVRIKKRIIC